MTKIAIIVYSLYGHINTMAEAVKKGVEASGAECTIFQVPETLPEEVLAKMGAPPKADYPVITAAQMEEFDGFLFGLSGRFGIIPAQTKSFMDSTGGLWQGGKLVGKAGGCFFSTGCQGGGQETIGLSAVTFFTHHGMVFVPLGYVDPKVFTYEEVHGGSPYGSGTIAGPDGSRMPSQLEKDVAESHGKHFATITAKLAK
mmetsp:Transcript_26601/g.56209  ORF Transcript_26601/g.56209 Transcript_26601/m.56209 type:complete len:200 (+) Transcript_26601:71-670(+)|eukprot:CAMPEP_0183702412 /NCGR_PEP_ID=MMETSP0737-20130205/521_1 /TAXON_ID=385413 /ORGANISM="Thalassiosira miniscula, Strain CCMP1093" /LENGTH=199 /DNA_ID=CAMNT_0025929011 /DNA_START=37 /DNA_END=636 /DNA_ORIENTATION=+